MYRVFLSLNPKFGPEPGWAALLARSFRQNKNIRKFAGKNSDGLIRRRGVLKASPVAVASPNSDELMDSGNNFGDSDLEYEAIDGEVDEEIEVEIDEEDEEDGGGGMGAGVNSVLVEDAGFEKGTELNFVLLKDTGFEKGLNSYLVEDAGVDETERGGHSAHVEDAISHKEAATPSASAGNVDGDKERGTQSLELESFQELKPSDTESQQIADSNLAMPSVNSNLSNDQTTFCSQGEELRVNGEKNKEDNDPVDSLGGCKNSTQMEICCSIENVDLIPTEDDSSKAKGNDVLSTMSVTNHVAPEVGVTQRQPRLPGHPLRLRESSSGPEHDVANKKSKTICRYHARGWCMKGNSCRFLHVKEGLEAKVKTELLKEASPVMCLPPQQSRDNSRFISHTEHMESCNVFGATPLQIVQGGRFGDGNSTVSSLRGGYIERDTTYHGNFPSCSNASRDHHIGTGMSHIGSESDGSDMVCSDDGLADNSKSSQSLPFGFTSWSTYAHAAQNIMGNTVKHHHPSLGSSFQPNISLHSSAELGNLSQNHFVADRGRISHESKFSSYAWESSIPFRPSHAITRNLLVKELPHEPTWNVTGEKRKRESKVKDSFSDQGSSVKDFNVRSDCSPGEEKLQNPDQVGDTVEAHVLSSSNDNCLKVEHSNNEKDVKIDRSGDKDEADIDIRRDDLSKNESKPLRYLQTALIEYVKELVKPTWRQGLMSKDAHKIIVKKSVDKVLSTLQPHQIPGTSESVDLYLSSSHSKLAELVEAYIDIYGKT